MASLTSLRALAPRPRRGTALLFTVVMGIGFPLLAASPAFAAACGAGTVGVTPLHGSTFYTDNSPSPPTNPLLQGQYEGFKLTNNTGAALNGAYVKIDTFNAGSATTKIGLAPGETGVDQADNMAAGGTSVSYFYLQAMTSTNTSPTDVNAQTHTIHVYDRNPSLAGAVELCSTTFTYIQVISAIQASANKVDIATNTSNPPGIGAIMTMTVSGHTGTVGSGETTDPDSSFFQTSPATVVIGANGTTGWRPDVFRMISAKVNIDLTTNAGTTTTDNFDFLKWHFTAANPGDRAYVATFTFKIIGTTTATITPTPVQNISSGTQTKHTDFSTIQAISPIQPTGTSATTTLAKSASPTSVYNGSTNTVTYTVTATNTGPKARTVTDGATTSGTKNVTSATAAFTAADVGKAISGTNIPVGSAISSVTNSTTVVITSNATATGSNITLVIGTDQDAIFDTFTDTLPSGISYVSGTAKFNGVTTTDPNISGQVLTFTGPFTVPAQTSRSLTYNVSYPSGMSPGTKVNSVVGAIGNVQIDTTASTLDNSPATSTVTILASPVAVNDAYTTAANTPKTVAAPGVLTNDTGTSITVTSNTNPTHGTVTQNANGSLTYTPTNGYSGPDSYTYTITDSGGQTSTATVNITVTPVATNDAYTTALNTPKTVAVTGVLGNDIGTGITVTSNTNPTHGTVTQNADGSLTYTPTNGYSGTDSYTYTITDSSGQTATATVNLTITPLAVNDSYTTAANTPKTVNVASGVLANDGGTGITVTSNTSPTHGTVTQNADGSLTYTPTNGYSGTDSYTYTITDSSGGTSTATVNILITPTAVNDSYSTAYQTPVTISAPGVLVNDLGTGLTVTANTNPTHGTLTQNADGSLTYTPNSGYSGPDSYTYTITDSNGQTSTATVNLTVGLPGAPVANDDFYTTAVNTPKTVAAPGVLGNDTGTSITVLSHTNPTHGTVTQNADGSLTYTPTNGYSGTDTYTYTITDSFSQTATATVHLTITPLAVDDSYTTAANTPKTVVAAGVLTNDVGTSLTVTAHTDPTHGTVTQNADGSLTYTPTNGYSGPDSYTYTITDGSGQTSTATVNITVTPVAVPDSYTVAAGGTLTVPATGVLGNDVGTGLSVTAHTNPTHGTLTQNADGSLTYTPTAGYSGADSYTYTITDSSGQTSTTTVSITVTPLAADDFYSVNQGSTLTVPANGILGNDTGTGLTVTAHTNPPNGTVTQNADGSLTYTPNAGFAGTDTYDYTITDSNGQTATATVHITVNNVVPVAVDDYYTFPTNTSSGTTPRDLDSDPGGDPLTITAVTQPASGGTVTINPGNLAATYTPPLNFTGFDTYTYTISDGHGGTATATDHIIITGTGLRANDRLTVVGIGGTTAGAGAGYDQLALSTPYRLQSQQLWLTLRNGFVPQPGDTFDIVTAPSIGGAYAAVYGQVLANGTVLEVHYLPDRVRLVAMPGLFVDDTTDLVDTNPGDGTCVASNGHCTLRAAVQEANAHAGADAIVLKPNATFTLSIAGVDENAAATGDLDITGTTGILGQGAVINGGSLDRVMHVVGATVTMTKLSLTNGNVNGTALPGAGALFNDGGDVNAVDTTLLNSVGVLGGGLGTSGGTTVLNRGTITGNSASMGGGIVAFSGSVLVDAATVSSNTASSLGGGLAAASSGTLTVSNATITSNSAPIGGGLASLSPSTVNINRSTFSANSAGTGGGVATNGTVNFTDTRITGNTAANGGGGYNYGTFNLVRTTFDANTATTSGGGIGNEGTLSLNTSTMSANAAPLGSAIYERSGSVALVSTTITKHVGATTVDTMGTTATIRNSIVADQVSGTGCASAITTQDYNLGSDSTCGLSGAHDQQGASAQLGALANNGGWSPTHLPGSASPEMNTGLPAPACSGQDQRGWKRPNGSACEKGAVER